MKKISLPHLGNKIKLKLCQKLCLSSKNKDLKPSSFPFISGDTFRSFADLSIENLDNLNFFQENFSLIDYEKFNILFISISFLEKNFEKLKQVFLIDSLKKKLKKIKLIFHNGDTKISDIQLNFFSENFKEIYIVHQIEKFKNIYPVPIGLENLSLRRAGLTNYYMEYQKNKIYNKNIKNCILFSSFNIYTNVNERQNLKNLIDISRHKFLGGLIPSDEYLVKLSNSYFTISPPGNGNDTHRTWEAIYLDCVPVVKRGFLSKYLIENLPILEVDKWELFLEKNDEELKILYNKIIKKNNKIAYADYWLNKLKN